MEVAECKNKRSANFTSTEETRLVELVKKYKHILECKMSDTKANQQKTECWNSIEKEFNGTVGQTYRPQNVLRTKYENIKKRVKKKFAEDKSYMRGTGGGPPKEIKITDLDSEVKELLGARVEGFPSQFDDDAEVNGENGPSCWQESTSESSRKNQKPSVEDWEQLKNLLIPVGNDVELEYIEATDEDCTINAETAESKAEVVHLAEDSDKMVSDWSKYNPKMLKEKKSAALQIHKFGSKSRNNNVTVDKVCQWADTKVAIEESRKGMMEEENKLKVKHMQEKHELELHLMKLKASLEIKHMQEIHDENMRILKLRNEK